MANDLILCPTILTTISRVVVIASDHHKFPSECKEDLEMLGLTLEMITGFLLQVERKHGIGDSHSKRWLLRLRDAAEEAEEVLEETAYEHFRHEVEADHKSKLKKVSHFFTHSNHQAVWLRNVGDKIKRLNKYLNDIKSGLKQVVVNDSQLGGLLGEFCLGFPDPSQSEEFKVKYEVLKSSLDCLVEPALKLCFALFSFFPKGFVMDREMLIQLWMAEGLLVSSSMATEEEEEEELGDKYFNDLLSCSLLQEVGRDACKLHNLVHDVSKWISASDTVVFETHSQMDISNIRHLNLICEGGKIMSALSGDVARKLHTLFSKHGFSNGVQVEDLKRLRVLSFSGATDARQLPTCFGNSTSLRFLDISGTRIEELPRFISKFHKLQTFRFNDCKSLIMPPEGIVHLINLRHIYFDDEERMPANIGRLTSLRTLQLFFVGTIQGRKIEELGSLRRLKGRLEIHNLHLVKDRSEASRARLHEKEIHELELKWGQGYHSRNDASVLEGLKPHSNLQQLRIDGYGGESLPSWMLERPAWLKLESLTFRRCKMLAKIRDIHGFQSLGQLYIEDCKELTTIASTDLMSKSLKNLDIKLCPKLKSVPENGVSSLTELAIEKCANLEWISMRGFRSLRKLHITLCMVRTIEDNLPTCLEDLYLRGCPELRSIRSLDGLVSLKSVEIMGCTGLEGLPSGLFSCTDLQVLTISSCDNLVSLPGELKKLPSLVELKVEHCPKLTSFPKGFLGCFPSLKRLSIGPFSKSLVDFPGLSYIDEDLPMSLEELHLFGWETLADLPCGIQSLTALKELQIWWFSQVECLPDWLGNLSSLQHLGIHLCNNLKYLPSAKDIRRLSKLQKLEIKGCPRLEKRCDKESRRPEWLKICHITNISIGGKVRSRR